MQELRPSYLPLSLVPSKYVLTLGSLGCLTVLKVLAQHGCGTRVSLLLQPGHGPYRLEIELALSPAVYHSPSRVSGWRYGPLLKPVMNFPGYGVWQGGWVDVERTRAM